jgi:pimeloyl-ACP methyl ester carboxylesterase
MKKKLVFSLTILALLLSSCKSDAPTPTKVALLSMPTPKPTAPTAPVATDAPPTAAPSPTQEMIVRAFESAPCPFELPPGQVDGESVECGYLLVPEDRADPDSATLRLAVAIFRHPDGASAPDPIVYLSGGPGGSALEFVFLSFDLQFAPVFDAGRDLILLDQRGVGLSEPALDCPEESALSLDLLDSKVDGKEVSMEEALDLLLQALLTCEDDLGAIADLSAYNTVSNAADVNDLRVALGYEQVNLWATSYGTRLALGVMRDYPQGLRSVVLDGTYPPDVDLYLESPANLERAAGRLFQACAADAACNAAFPDLRAVFFDTVERLNEEPASFQVTNALTNESYDMSLEGDSMMGLLFEFLYLTEVLPSLPQIIYDASQGNFDKVALVYGSLLAQADVVSTGMQFSVQCNEELAFSSPQEFESVLAAYPQWKGVFEGPVVGKIAFDVCAGWDSGQADPIENQAVRSDVPTLILAGEYDPITPPAWGQHAAETLTHSYFFEYPGVGHGASLSGDCPRGMMLAFLDDPSAAPDDACIADMGMQFALPSEGLPPVELEPFSGDPFGFSGLVPVGWQELAPGSYMRGESALDPTALVQSGAPVPADVLLASLSERLGLDGSPESAGDVETAYLTWTLYTFEVQGQAADMALAESDAQAYLVLLVSVPGERDALYESVFLPVVEALKPLE